MYILSISNQRAINLALVQELRVNPGTDHYFIKAILDNDSWAILKTGTEAECQEYLSKLVAMYNDKCYSTNISNTGDL